MNIGKTKVVPDSEAVRDHEKSAGLLAPFADYLVVNVSSPNTPGLRDLQAVDRLEPLLAAVRRRADDVTDRHVPLLVKIAPDLADDDVLAVADLALASGLDGIVATNTTIGRTGLSSPDAEVEAAGGGGLSGPPLRDRATEVLRLLRGPGRHRPGPRRGGRHHHRRGRRRAAPGRGRPAPGLHGVRLRGPVVARPHQPRDRPPSARGDVAVSASFGRRLHDAIAARGPLCVGIDPHPGLLEAWGLPDDADGLERFAMTTAEALADRVAAIKPQSRSSSDTARAGSRCSSRCWAWCTKAAR